MYQSKVTIKDIANDCQVSVATVSRVLNNNYFVSPEIRDRVLDSVKRLHYVPNSIARSLKIQKSGLIGYITADISNSYHISVAKGIEDIIRPLDYSLLVCSTSSSQATEEKYLSLLLNRGVDALALNSCGLNDDLIAKINKDLPIVLVNRRISTPVFHGDLADCNNTLGTYLLTKELAAVGHRRIMIVEGPRHLFNVRERFSGFRIAMGEYGIEISDDYPYRFTGDFSIESGVNAIEFFLALPERERPTAFLGTNNLTTIGILKGLQSHKFTVPEDVSVAGFNRIDNTELYTVRPTMASFDPYEIGQAAGKAILERLENNYIENREFIFPPKIIHGNSISAPKTY